MSEISVYSFGGEDVALPIRVTKGHEGELWFVAADICRAIEIDNTSAAVGRLDDDERGINSINTPSGDQQMLCVTESGLYSLVLSSRSKKARSFKRWVTSEVLPSIRKTGKYEVKTVPVEIQGRIENDPVTQQLLQLLEVRKDFIVLQARQESMVREIAVATTTAQTAIATAQSVEATVSGRTGFKTTLGYAISRGYKIEKKRLAVVGKRVAAEAKRRGIEGVMADDERYDKVRSWPSDFLESVDDMFKTEARP